MALTENDKQVAVELVLRDPRIRVTCRRDPERVGKIVDTVWEQCKVYDDKYQLTRADNDWRLVQGFCLAALEKRADYDDVVSFIPAWLLAVIIKVIISILIDFWLLHEKGK